MGQIQWQESSVAGAGGCFVSRHGPDDGRYNQAGLGWITHHSLSVQHAQPFILPDLGISALSIQIPSGTGGFGASISSFGITGLKQTATWISYGLKLHPDLSAGLGIHCWNSSTRDHLFFHVGASFAMGIQFRFSKKLILGAHIRHPVVLPDRIPAADQLMMISTGVSYHFFNTATYHSDLRILPKGDLQWCHGLEVRLRESFRILMGMHNHPYAVSAGISLKLTRFSVSIAVIYKLDTGTTPSSTISYAW